MSIHNDPPYHTVSVNNLSGFDLENLWITTFLPKGMHPITHTATIDAIPIQYITEIDNQLVDDRTAYRYVIDMPGQHINTLRDGSSADFTSIDAGGYDSYIHIVGTLADGYHTPIWGYN